MKFVIMLLTVIRNMVNLCSAWCGSDCIDGTCPIANFADREERCYDLVHSCSDCYVAKSCDTCVFQDSPICPYYE